MASAGLAIEIPDVEMPGSVQFAPLQQHSYGHKKSERLLRRILIYYGHTANYEPYEFIAGDSVVIPDFLVDGKFFIELTTARKNGHRSEKNRKLMALTENGVDVYIISRPSFRDLIGQYRLDLKTGKSKTDLFRFLRKPGEGYKQHAAASPQLALQPAYV